MRAKKWPGTFAIGLRPADSVPLSQAQQLIFQHIYKEEFGMIDVYFWPTPNGHKVTVALEELELPYNVIPINIGSGGQFNSESLTLGRNNPMPPISTSYRPRGPHLL